MIPQTGQYALRAMAYLAMLEPAATARAQDISKAACIPGGYLSKLLRRLVVSGLLISRKGHGGGFMLARPPSQIRFADVLEAVDTDLVPDCCAFGWGTCDEDNPCPLHPMWSRLNTCLNSWLEDTMLSEVLINAMGPPRRPANHSDEPSEA